jgi:hypothetical protein
MAVAGKNGAVKNTSGGDFTVQTYSGVALGVTDAANIMTRGFSHVDALADNQLASRDVGPRELTGAGKIYNAKKPLAGGTFAYNASKDKTYVASRLSTTLSGVANNALLFMAQGNLRKPINVFTHDFGARMLTAWRAGLFAPLGRTTAGTKLLSRRLWLDSADRTSTAGAPLGTLTTANMVDLTDGNATDMAVDDAATPSRLYPGELVVKVDFVTVDIATSGNNLSYKPITHA